LAADLIQDRAHSLLEEYVAESRNHNCAILRGNHVRPKPLALRIHEQQLGLIFDGLTPLRRNRSTGPAPQIVGVQAHILPGPFLVRADVQNAHAGRLPLCRELLSEISQRPVIGPRAFVRDDHDIGEAAGANRPIHALVRGRVRSNRQH
jgi:hypothetical protein